MRKLFTGITLSLLSLIITLLICEFIARLMLPPPILVDISNELHFVNNKAEIPIAKIDAQQGTQHALDQGLSYWGSHGHRYRPNVSAKVDFDGVSSRSIEYRTNSLGMLEREISTLKGPNETRILMIGDSITAGVGVPQEERFSNILNHSLSKVNNNVAVFNGGISGLNAEESLYHYTEIQPKISPDIVVFNLYLNDANNSGLFISKVAPYPFSESYLATWLVRSSDLLRKHFYLTKDTSHQRKLKWSEEFRAGRSFEPAPWNGDPFMQSIEAMDYAVYKAYLDWGLGWSDIGWQELRQTLRALKVLTQKNNQIFVVVLFPVSYQVYAAFEDNRPNLHFKKTCSALGINCIDLLPELRQRYKQDKKLLFYDHCHYNPYGHQTVSEIIEKGLSEFDLLAAGR